MALLYVFQNMHVLDFQLTIDRILLRIDDDERPLASVSECDRGEPQRRSANAALRRPGAPQALQHKTTPTNHWWTEEEEEAGVQDGEDVAPSYSSA